MKNTIKKEIEFGPINFGIPLEEDNFSQYIQFIFPNSEMNTSSALNLHPFNLSWGEKRRLNLSSLFAYSPRIFLFDEPFTGQDYVVREKLIKNIKSIASSFEIPVSKSSFMA